MTDRANTAGTSPGVGGVADTGHLLRTCFVAMLALLILCVALAYIPAAFSAFTSFKFTLTDYGRYVNTVWNCGHGHPYRLLTQYSYLNTHLSFTLLLLAPVFLVWNHPFALWSAQWLMALAGLGIMWRAAARHRMPGEVTAAFLLFHLANPYTQSVLLSEFHGVGLYLLLLPWLYYCLAFQRRLVWLPLLLTWGVREEAAFLVLPMLLYFTIRDRWRGGWLWTAATGIYGLLACTLLFRWINGFAISAERPGLRPSELIDMLKASHIQRFIPTLTLFAPALPFLYRGWLPILTFPAVALLFTIFSPYPAQFNLKFHYPAALETTLALGILHGLAIFWQAQPRHPLAARWLQAIFLVTITALFYFYHGFLFLGRYNASIYRRPNLPGLSTLCAASRIPEQGLLLTDRRTGGMCANRGEMIIWEQYASGRWQPDIIFTSIKDLARKHAKTLQPLLKNGTFGVFFSDGNHLILVRGHSRAKNRAVLEAASNGARTIRFAFTKKKAGTEIMMPDCRLVRFWDGTGGRTAEPLVAYGKTITLGAGDYIARFRLRAQPVDRPGILRLNERASQATLARAAIQVPSGSEGSFFEQSLPLHLAQQTRVEPEVLGGAGKLWLESVVLEPIAQSNQ